MGSLQGMHKLDWGSVAGVGKKTWLYEISRPPYLLEAIGVR